MNGHFANLNANKRTFAYASAHYATTRKRLVCDSIRPILRLFEVSFFGSISRKSATAFVAAAFAGRRASRISPDDLISGVQLRNKLLI
jgi:hypothetical protein